MPVKRFGLPAAQSVVGTLRFAPSRNGRRFLLRIPVEALRKPAMALLNWPALPR